MLTDNKPKTAYMVHNDTYTIFFEDRDDAEIYAGQYGAASGLQVIEIVILPKGCCEGR